MVPQQEQPVLHASDSLYDRSQAAFYRNLPELLRKHCGQWVAYQGDEFVGSARTQTELFQRCVGRGLKDDEFIVLFADHTALGDHEETELPWPP
jgi:hypothetical protein